MKKKRIICIILILIFASGIVIGAIQLYKQYHEYSEGEDSYTDLEEYVKLPGEPEAPSSSPADDETESGGREWPAASFWTAETERISQTGTASSMGII